MSIDIGVIQNLADIGVIQSASTAYTASLNLDFTTGAAVAATVGVPGAISPSVSIEFIADTISGVPASFTIASTYSLAPATQLAGVNSITIAESIGADTAGVVAALNAFAFGSAFDIAEAVAQGFPGDVTFGVVAGVSGSVEVAFNPALSLAITAAVSLASLLAGVASFQINSTLESAIAPSNEVPASFGFGVEMDITASTPVNAAGIMSMGITTGPSFSTLADMVASLGLSYTVAIAEAGGLLYPEAFSLDSTFDILITSGLFASFAFGVVHEVSPMITQLGAAGAVNLGITANSALSPMVSAAEPLGLTVQIDPQIRSNINGQSSISPGFTLAIAEVGGLLYTGDVTLALEASVAYSTRLAAHNAFQFGIQAAITEALISHLFESMSLSAALSLSLGSTLNAKGAVTLGITAASGIVGGRLYSNAFSLGISAHLDASPLLNHGGPDIFMAGPDGTPVIFVPATGDTPGIFKPVDDDTPGIFKPTAG